MLATNTSSIPVTSLAGAAARPENVVGMHFFNPPPLMRLLEVIRADQTGERAFETARATGEAMGKQVIVAADGPGFLVNRCGRPFNGEGLRLLQERVASHEQIDRICRLGGGFRMGPFELMDLVGIDVGFEVAKSFTELSFGEPRWRPSPLQARMVAAGRLGRKTGRGWYEYAEDGSLPPAPIPRRRSARMQDLTPLPCSGTVRSRSWLRERARDAGIELREGGPAELVVDAGARAAMPRRPAVRRSSCCAPAAASPRAASRPRPASTCCRRSASRRSSSSRGCRPRPAFVGRGGRGLLRRRSASSASGSRTRPGSCSAASSPSSSTRRHLRSARGSAPRTTSTPGSSSGSPTRAGRSRGARRSGSPTCSRSSTASGRSAARSATARRRCFAARRSSGVAFASAMATADLTVLALGRSDVSASGYIAEIQRRLARQERVRYRMHAMGTSLEGSTEDILGVVGELHALPVRAGRPARLHGPEARRAPRPPRADARRQGALGRGPARRRGHLAAAA